ncbi:MAG: bifunctional DNA-formamidopyrimidine glycosylase/DNA-(apurinic or apyrimidinic site) lyase [Bryobacteraceae bacterium]
MPELPEVETVVRELRPRLRGRHFLSVEIIKERIVRHSKQDVAQAITGSRIKDVSRQGKYILIELENAWLTIHLGMTGQILFNTLRTAYTRAIFQLDDATMMYEDVRMFGAIEVGRVRADRLGPDALQALTPDKLRRDAPIKAVLLNQAILGGVGNIYADEALYRAGIRPTARRLGPIRAKRLIDRVHEVLAEAIEHKGSSVSNYVDTEGRKGTFQQRHNVYGRGGLPCPSCAFPIRRIVVGGRGTHFCPRCQR